jgi:hypothetical protein
MKKKFGLFILCLAFASMVYAQSSGPFYWDLILGRSPGGDFLYPHNSIVKLDVNESLNITIIPQENCFCYIIWRGKDGKLAVLNNSQVQAGVGISAGAPRSSGADNLYIIMSRQKQEKLEGSIKSYQENSSSTQKSLALYSEIQNIQRAVNGLGEPVMQQGSIPGATTRGGSASPIADLPDGITRYSGQDRYVRFIGIQR